MLWRKSSYSNGSANGECVELGQVRRVILVRDTKDRAGFTLPVTPAAWQDFTGQMKEARLRS